MDVKKYIENQYKNWQANLKETVKNYSDNELKVQIEMNKQRIEENLYCKVSTPTKVKNLLILLENEQKLRL